MSVNNKLPITYSSALKAKEVRHNCVTESPLS